MRHLAARDATRRAIMLALAAQGTMPWPSAATDQLPTLQLPTLSERFSSTRLKPLSDRMPSMDGDLRYPKWMAGKWRATNTAVGFTTPLGQRFVDPYLLKIGQSDATTSKQRRYLLGYEEGFPPPAEQPTLTVRQARPFSTIQEERAFTASKETVIERGVFTRNAAHPHGRVVLDVKNDITPDGKPLSPYVGAGWEVRKTVKSQLELDIMWAAWEESGDNAFVTSELAVQRAELPRGAVDETYLEILFRFERQSLTGAAEEQSPETAPPPNAVRARYRVAQYLSLPDAALPAAATKEARKLAKEAAGRAVALLDYDVLLERTG